MALLMIEGFEGYASIGSITAQGGSAPCRWTGYQQIALDGGTYRTAQVTAANSRSLYTWTTGGNTLLTLTTPAITEVIVGFAFWYNSNSNSQSTICSIGKTGYTNQGVCFAVNTSTGILTAAIPAASGQVGTVLGTSSLSLTSSVWNYVELRVKLSATVGEVEVRVNGSQGLNLTNVNTAAGSLTSYERVVFGAYGAPSSSAWFWDDVYVLDTTGTTNNTFLGPISVYTLMPTGAGSSTQLTPTGTATNWQAVADAVENTTTYVETSTTGEKDYYTFQSLPAGVTTVAGVALKARSTIPGSGNRKVKLNLKNAASVISSALKSLALGSWLQEHIVADTAPDGSAWTPALVNSTEGGTEAG